MASRTKNNRGGQPDNTNAAKTSIYSRHFSQDELTRIVSALTNPDAPLRAAVEASAVLLDRILARLGDPASNGTVDDFTALVSAHNETSGRIANLLRTQRLLTDESANSITGHIAGLLDELSERLNVEL